MSSTIKRTFGPVAFSATAANIYNQGSALIFDTIRQIRVVNTTAGALPFSLFLSQVSGTETAGKEIAVGKVVPANDFVDMFMTMKMLSTDFLVGHANVGLTIMGFGTQDVV